MNDYEKRLQEMECGDTIAGERYTVTRVPGGWIYNSKVGATVFVPIPGINTDTIILNADNHKLIDEKEEITQ